MSCTLIVHPFKILALKGAVFTAANQTAIDRKNKAVLVAQAGYHRGEEMSVMETKSGGYRLYVKVGRQWMDGSLQDLPV